MVHLSFILPRLCENDPMPEFIDPSILIFVAFGIVGVAVVVTVGFFVVDRITPVVTKLFGGASPVSRLEAEVQRVLPHRRQAEENEDDDLDDSTASLLSVLPGASIVVDDDDEVVRASPAAYPGSGDRRRDRRRTCAGADP